MISGEITYSVYRGGWYTFACISDATASKCNIVIPVCVQQCILFVTSVWTTHNFMYNVHCTCIGWVVSAYCNVHTLHSFTHFNVPFGVACCHQQTSIYTIYICVHWLRWKQCVPQKYALHFVPKKNVKRRNWRSKKKMQRERQMQPVCGCDHIMKKCYVLFFFCGLFGAGCKCYYIAYCLCFTCAA